MCKHRRNKISLDKLEFSRRRFLKNSAGIGLASAIALSSSTQARAAPGEQEWVSGTVRNVDSSPTVIDGTVYVGSNDNNLYAVDVSTSEQEWAFKTDGMIQTSPTIVDDTVYIGSHDNNLYAVDVITGEQKWVFHTGDTVHSSPAVVDDTVYIGSNDNNLYAVDATTGEQEWEFTTGDSVLSSPTAVDGTVYIGSINNNLYAVNATTGEQEWEFTTGDSVLSSPTIIDRTVYVGSFDSKLYALEVDSGEERWHFQTGDRVYSSPTLVGGTVYVGSYDGNLYAVDTTTGEQEWVFKTGGLVRSSPTGLNGTVYVGSYYGNLYAVDTATGEQEWVFKSASINDSSPAVADGTVYIGGQDGLYGVDTGSEDDSDGSRVLLGTLGHTDTFAEQGPTLPNPSKDSVLKAEFTATPEEPAVGDTVKFDASGSTPATEIARYEWDLTDDGTVNATDESVEWTFEEAGNRSVTLTVVANDGTTATSSVVVPVGVQTGQLTGTVVGETDNLPESADVYAIAATRKHEALDYIGGARSSLPTYLADGTIDENNQVSFGSVEVGSYVILVDLTREDTFDSFLQDDIRVLADETTDAELSFDPDRPLAPLAEVVKEAQTAALEQNTQSLDPLTNVYLDGYELFVQAPELDGAFYLDKALTLTNTALGLADPSGSISAAAEIKSEATAELAIPIAEQGYNYVLAEQWEEVNGTQYQDELTGYTEEIQAADGILDFEPTNSVSEARGAFSETSIFNSRQDGIRNAFGSFSNDLVFTEPADGFALSEVKSILETQCDWLQGDGLAPGLVVTPSDSEYLVGRTDYYAAAFQNVKARFNAAEDLDLVAQGVSATGKGITLAGGWTVGGLAVGTVMNIGGWAASMALSMYQVHAKNRLADTWVKSLTYWVSDLADTERAYTDLISWMYTEVESPTALANIDGTVTASLDGVSSPLSDVTYLIANRPDYPAWWTLPRAQLKHVGTAEIEVENTGTESAQVRVLVSVYAGDEATGEVQPSDAVSMYPRPENPPLELAPGEIQTIELTYRADFELADALSWQTMSVNLWMDGKFVAETNKTFYVVPDVDFIPEASRISAPVLPDKSSTYGAPIGISTARSDETVALADQEVSALYGNTVNVIDAIVAPDNPNTTASYTVGDSLNTVVFMLQGVLEADIHLHVYDGQDRHIGFDPATGDDVIEIPGANYTGSGSSLEVITVPAAEAETLDVEATARSFTAGQPVELTVQAIEIPTRDAVMSVGETAISTVVSPGETDRFDINIREVGKQTTLEGVTLTAQSLTRSDGETLAEAGGTVGFGESGFDVAPGAGEVVELSVSLGNIESLSLPSGINSRYEGQVRIESANAGTIELELSVLVLDTDVAEVQLSSATETVTGVELTAAELAGLPEETIPSEVEPLVAYDVASTTVDGASESEFSLEVPDVWDSDAVAVYVIEEGSWSEANWERETGELALTLAGGVEGTVVIGAESESVAAYTTADGRIETEGLREAIEEWRGGEIGTRVLREVIDVWRTGDPLAA